MTHLVDYAKSFIGVKYKWGGENPLEGYDCSGLVQEILCTVGVDPRGDQSAQGLYDFFKIDGERKVFGPGALCFYGNKEAKIRHVSFMVDKYRVVEAGGGDSTTLTYEQAEDQSAFVRMRMFDHRRDFIEAIMPDYPEWLE